MNIGELHFFEVGEKTLFHREREIYVGMWNSLILNGLTGLRDLAKIKRANIKNAMPLKQYIIDYMY